MYTILFQETHRSPKLLCKVKMETDYHHGGSKKTAEEIQHLIDLCVCVCESHSCVQLFAISWTIVHQAPLSTEFSRQEYLSR